MIPIFKAIARAVAFLLGKNRPKAPRTEETK